MSHRSNEVSPRLTEAVCALAQTNTDGFLSFARNTSQAIRTTPPVWERNVIGLQIFLFQPASRMRLGRSPHQVDGSVAKYLRFI